MSAIDENEEFEFRLRAEKEAGQTAAPDEPKQTWGNLPANATNKMLAGTIDSITNAPTNIANLASAGAGYIGSKLGMDPQNLPDADFEKPNLGSKLLASVIHDRKMTPAQQTADKAIQSGVGMLISPANSLKQAAANVATGAIAAGTGDVVGKATDSPMAELATNIAMPMAIGGVSNKLAKAAEIKKSLNAERDATLEAGVKDGYRLPPSAVEAKFVNNRLEGIAGKAAIKQQAVAGNQKITNTLVAKELGLPVDQPITMKALSDRDAQYGKAYEEVANLPISARADAPYSYGAKKSIRSDVEDWKQANNDKNAWYEAYKRSASPEDLAKAKSYAGEATRLHNVLSDTAKRAGREDIIENLNNARVEIAKSYTARKALNDSNGEMDAGVFGRMFASGKPLSGEFLKIGKFNKSFPTFTTTGAKNPAAGVSKSEGIASILMGLGGSAALGPAGAILAATPLLSSPIRAMLLSKPFQGAPTESNIAKISKLLSNANTKDVQRIAAALEMQRQSQNGK